nr:MAG TPA: hypothetical protein [Caudoviricetes sp.]
MSRCRQHIKVKYYDYLKRHLVKTHTPLIII